MPRPASDFFESCPAADLGIRPVDRLEAKRPRCHHDPEEDVVPLVGGVVCINRPDRELRNARGCREVARSEDQGLGSPRCAGNALDLDQPSRELDLHLDSDRPLDAQLRFELGEDVVDGVDCDGSSTFGSMTQSRFPAARSTT
jgi:hypothetical protein